MEEVKHWGDLIKWKDSFWRVTTQSMHVVLRLSQTVKGTQIMGELSPLLLKFDKDFVNILEKGITDGMTKGY